MHYLLLCCVKSLVNMSYFPNSLYFTDHSFLLFCPPNHYLFSVLSCGTKVVSATVKYFLITKPVSDKQSLTTFLPSCSAATSCV